MRSCSTKSSFPTPTCLAKSATAGTRSPPSCPSNAAGPDRLLPPGPLLCAAVRALARGPVPDDSTAADIGDLMARLISLRQLSLSVARTLTDGGDAANQAALGKDLRTR